MPYLTLLQELDDIAIRNLCTSHRTTKQAALSVMLAKATGADVPTQITVLPKIDLDFSGKPKMLADEILGKYGADVVKLILLHSIGTKKKDIVIPSSMIHFMRVSMDKLGVVDQVEQPALEDLWKTPLERDFSATLKLIRTGRVNELNNTLKWLIKYAEC